MGPTDPFPGLTNDRQKTLGQKNGSMRSGPPLSQSTIFLSLYFFAFHLLAAKGRAGCHLDGEPFLSASSLFSSADADGSNFSAGIGAVETSDVCI